MTDTMLRHAAWMARCLGRGELFPFSNSEIEELASSIGVRRVDPGTRLMTEGQPVEFIGLVESGEVELYRRAGLRRVALQILRESDLLGDIPFFCRTRGRHGSRRTRPPRLQLRLQPVLRVQPPPDLPAPPRENWLAVPIRAGERAFRRAEH